MVNPAKSKALPVNLPPSDLVALKRAFSFQWLSSLLYLGIKLTPTYAGLYQANNPPLFSKLSAMFSSWSHLSLSWFGRIVTVCMSYIPKLLYFFRILLVPVPSHILHIHQRKLLKFIWGSTQPRVNKQVLYACRINGGFFVPNLQAYYPAASIAP